jgi:hypothetical protein
MRLNNKYVTPPTIGLGVIAIVSGGVQFFGVKNAPIHVIHEWLGVAFAAVVVLHLINHSKSTIGYFKKPLSIGIIAAALLAGGVFYALVPQKGGGGNVAKITLQRTYSAPIAVSAPVFGLTSNEATDKLRLNGIAVEGDESIAALAKKYSVTPDKIAEALIN